MSQIKGRILALNMLEQKHLVSGSFVKSIHSLPQSPNDICHAMNSEMNLKDTAVSDGLGEVIKRKKLFTSSFQAKFLKIGFKKVARAR